MFQKVDKKVLKAQTDRVNEVIKSLKSKSITETNNLIKPVSVCVAKWIGLKKVQDRKKIEPRWKCRIEWVIRRVIKEFDFLESEVKVKLGL